MSEVESVGEIVTGGLIAGAVEPGAGGDSPTREATAEVARQLARTAREDAR